LNQLQATRFANTIRKLKTAEMGKITILKKFSCSASNAALIISLSSANQLTGTRTKEPSLKNHIFPVEREHNELRDTQ
jgi:hypothetical protein